MTEQPDPIAASMRDMYNALDLEENEQVTEMVLIAKVSNFEKGGTGISFSATTETDWITQLGMLEGARILTEADHLRAFRDE